MSVNDWKRGYMKGYSTRSEHWPLHLPPLPPDPILAELILSAQALRDECDRVCSTFPGDDPEAIALGQRIDKFDAAQIALTRWLRDTSPQPQDTKP